MSSMFRRHCCSTKSSFNDNCFYNLQCGPDTAAILASETTPPSFSRRKRHKKHKHKLHNATLSATKVCEGHDFGDHECSAIDCCVYDEGTCIANGKKCRGPTTSPTQRPTRDTTLAPTSQPTYPHACEEIIERMPEVCAQARGAGYYCSESCKHLFEFRLKTIASPILRIGNLQMMKLLEAKGLQHKCKKQLYDATHNEFCWPHDCMPVR